LTDAVNEAHEKAREARMAILGRAGDLDLQAALEDAEAALEAAEKLRQAKLVTFRFRALGGTDLEAMERRFPVTKEQLELYRSEQKRLGQPTTNPPRHDVDEFPPALISASCVSPVITLEKAKELWDSENWSKAERAALFQTAWAVNAMG
jgi:hypothetical protein